MTPEDGDVEDTSDKGGVSGVAGAKVIGDAEVAGVAGGTLAGDAKVGVACDADAEVVGDAGEVGDAEGDNNEPALGGARSGVAGGVEGSTAAESLRSVRVKGLSLCHSTTDMSAQEGEGNKMHRGRTSAPAISHNNVDCTCADHQ